jgi:O-antigen/teichoic acid export membrane protein
MNFLHPKTGGISSEASDASVERSSMPTVLTEDKDLELSRKQFSTEHLLPNLKHRTISSAVVTIAAQGAKFALNLLSTVVLARLLTPLDFGMIAMVWTMLAFLEVFKDAGLSTATIQCEQLTHAQVSNLFWINVGLGGILAALSALSAPVITWFYGDSRLAYITLGLSVTYLLSGSTVQHMALLKRQMRFKALALIDIGSIAVGLITGISTALLGFRYWSLVIMNLATVATALILTWSASGWRPQFVTFGVGTKRLVGFGANLTGAGFLYYVSRSMDTLLLGRRYGSEAVGLYSRAMGLLARPLDLMLSPIGAVFVPALSRLQSEPERYRRTFLQVYESIALIGFSVTGLLLALAHPLTLVILGAKWEGSAAIFAGFMVGALCSPLSAAATWLFTSQGRGRDNLITHSILSSLIVASFFAGLPFGPVGVAMAFSVSGLCVRIPILYYLVGRQGPVRRNDLWAVLLRHLPVWVVSFGVTYLMRTCVIHLGSFSQLLICVPVALMALAVFILIAPPQRRVASNLLRLTRQAFSSNFDRKRSI